MKKLTGPYQIDPNYINRERIIHKARRAESDNQITGVDSVQLRLPISSETVFNIERVNSIPTLEKSNLVDWATVESSSGQEKLRYFEERMTLGNSYERPTVQKLTKADRWVDKNHGRISTSNMKNLTILSPPTKIESSNDDSIISVYSFTESD